jgi:hypothetical protein
LVFWFSENIYMDIVMQTIILMPCAHWQFVNKNSFSDKCICIYISFGRASYYDPLNMKCTDMCSLFDYPDVFYFLLGYPVRSILIYLWIFEQQKLYDTPGVNLQHRQHVLIFLF